MKNKREIWLEALFAEEGEVAEPLWCCVWNEHMGSLINIIMVVGSKERPKEDKKKTNELMKKHELVSRIAS